jgi:excisionase family DNA binding protein
MSNETALLPLRVSVKQAADILSISSAYCYRLIGEGTIRAQRDGAKTFVSAVELARYVSSLEPAAPAKPTPKRRARAVAMD